MNKKFTCILMFFVTTSFAKGLDELTPSKLPKDTLNTLNPQPSENADTSTNNEGSNLPNDGKGEEAQGNMVTQEPSQDSQMQSFYPPLNIQAQMSLDLVSWPKLKGQTLKGLGGAGIGFLWNPFVEATQPPTSKFAHGFGLNYSTVHAYFQKSEEHSYDLYGSLYSLTYQIGFFFTQDFVFQSSIDVGYQEFKLISSDSSLPVSKSKDQVFVAMSPSAVWYFDSLYLGPKVSVIFGDFSYLSLGLILGVRF